MTLSHTASVRRMKKTTDADSTIGRRIRERRQALGLTQTDLADALGVTFQQVQKYERGWNRISASRLQDLSRVFEVPLDYFFADQDGRPGANVRTAPPGKADPSLDREVLELVRAFRQVRSKAVRRQVLLMLKSAAQKP